jgi:hypothetical protein
MEPSGTQHFGKINETLHQVDLRLGMREILGLPPFIRAKLIAPTPLDGYREEDETLLFRLVTDESPPGARTRIDDGSSIHDMSHVDPRT